MSHFAPLSSAFSRATLRASDWPRFRGANGGGVSADPTPVPTEWSDSQNLAWSVDLPGPGSSSPIVVGDRVLITCWTGEDAPDMVRHLLCYNRKTGELLYDKPVPPSVEDERFRGQFTQHGYATHTPTSDGNRIYCFFGKDGVRAYNMDGKELWQKNVGQGSDPRGWGTASSPILYKDLVIVTAGAESTSIVALRQENGEEAWKQEAEGLAGLWGTPVLCDNPEGGQDLVIAVAGELWGVNPDTGKLRWFAVAGRADSMCGSAIAANGVAYMLGERGAGMIAVPAGGMGDMSEKVAWRQNYSGRISTPVIADGLIYYVGNGSVNCIDAGTGEQVYSERLQSASAPAAPPAEGEAGGAPPAGGGGGEGERGGRGGRRGGRGGRGGGMGGQDYSSPVIAGGKMYFTRRSGEVYVIQTGREFKQIAANKFSGEADFSATPAVSDGQLFIRSSKKLYCVAAK